MRILPMLSFVATAVFLQACATPAQEEFATDKKVTGDTVAKMKACSDAASSKPEYAALWSHTPKNIAEPTLQQLSDLSYLQPNLKPLYLSWRADEALCRPAADPIRTVDVKVVWIMHSAWSDEDAIRAKLVTGQATWGDTNAQIAAISHTANLAVSDEFKDLTAELGREDQGQIIRRAAIAMAFSSAMQQEAQRQQQQTQYQQQRMENQQLINAINRPVTTNCNSYGSITSCTSN